VSPEAIPFYEDGDELTCVPTADVLGGRFVKISGDVNADGNLQIAPCGADEKAFGVAMWDAVTGVKVTVRTINSGHVMPVKAGNAGLAAGDSVKSGAAGVAVVGAAGDPCYGTVLTGCSANADAKVSLGAHSLPAAP
jgi:hypothetical protein